MVLLSWTMGSLKNQILISMPHMTDPFFSKSVIYICEHNIKGAMGMIINKQFNEPELNAIMEKVFIKDNSLKPLRNDIYFGGPVLLEKGIVLHHGSYMAEDSIAISKSIAIASKQGVLDELKKKEDVPFKIMLGHAGWSSGQLEREIENGDWLMQSTTADFIFNVTPNQMWEQATESLGLDLGSSFGMTGQA